MDTEEAPEVPGQQRSDAQPTGPISLADHVNELLLQTPSWSQHLVHLGREGMLQTEGEIRRGVVAVNGACLLAVISLLSQSLHTYTVKAAALLYLLGLLLGWVSWTQRVTSSRAAFFAQTAFTAAFTTIKDSPEAQKPLATEADVDAARSTLQSTIALVGQQLKKPGEYVPL